jgi:hypothetical protein
MIWDAILRRRMRLGEAAGRRPESAQPTEMPNALSPISTTVVETRLQQPAAANAIASAKKKRFTDKTRPPHIPIRLLAGDAAERHHILN